MANNNNNNATSNYPTLTDEWNKMVENLKRSTYFHMDPIKPSITIKAVEEKPEEWIWVEGYKATDKDMKCRDYQYILNKKHDMPEDAEIKDCESGFHFCKDLKDVFSYYRVKDGNRFFKVSALVKKKDYEEYGVRNGGMFAFSYRDKLAAKSIVFLSELTADEILAADPDLCNKVKDFTDEEKAEVIQTSYDAFKRRKGKAKLIELGYSEAFADYVAKDFSYSAIDVAVAVASQPGLSMDMKVLAILREHYDD